VTHALLIEGEVNSSEVITAFSSTSFKFTCSGYILIAITKQLLENSDLRHSTKHMLCTTEVHVCGPYSYTVLHRPYGCIVLRPVVLPPHHHMACSQYGLMPLSPYTTVSILYHCMYDAIIWL